jgi:hypothetical protein
MGWDKKRYKACKRHMDYMVSHHPWCYDADIATWIRTWSNFMDACAQGGDYEGAQATKDAIFDLFKRHGHPIPKEAMLIIDKDYRSLPVSAASSA